MMLKQKFDELAQNIRQSNKDSLVLFVLRHGESVGQLDRAAYKNPGDNLIPLTPIGVQQAIAAGQILGAVADDAEIPSFRIISSYGRRSTHTAMHISSILKERLPTTLKFDHRLDKQKFGLFDGLFTQEEREQRFPVEYARFRQEWLMFGEFHARPPHGESIANVQSRLALLLKELKEDPQPTILVTHGTNTLCIENILCHRGSDWVLRGQDQRLNCSIQSFQGSAETGFRTRMLVRDPLQWMVDITHEEIVDAEKGREAIGSHFPQDMPMPSR